MKTHHQIILFSVVVIAIGGLYHMYDTSTKKAAAIANNKK